MEKHVHTHTSKESSSHTHEFISSSDQELIALLKYMINHNESHNIELEELAHEFIHKDLPKENELVLEALKDFSNGNLKLKEVLSRLEKS